MATEKLPPQEEAIGLETPAFDRLLPICVSIRAKNSFQKFAANQSGERVGGIFLFLELWGDYETICVVPRQGSHL